MIINKERYKIIKSIDNQRKILKMYNSEIEYTDFLFDKFFTKTLGPIFPEIDFEIPDNLKQKQGYYSRQHTNLIENDDSGGKTVYSKSVVNNDGEIKTPSLKQVDRVREIAVATMVEGTANKRILRALSTRTLPPGEEQHLQVGDDYKRGAYSFPRGWLAVLNKSKRKHKSQTQTHKGCCR